MNYRCVYMYRGQALSAEGQRLEDFSSGFWVPDPAAMRQVGPVMVGRGDARKIWIPPHKIEWIEEVIEPLGAGPLQP